MPKVCTVCGGEVARDGELVALRCQNPHCDAKNIRALYYFASKSAFNIDGLGPKVIDLLVENNLVSEPADFFELQTGDISGLDRMGEKSAENLVAAIDKARPVPLAELIISLGIPDVGEETAHDLATHFQNIDKLRKASQEELEAVYGIGVIVSRSVLKYFSEKKNNERLDRLLKHITVLKPEAVKKATPLSGKTVVVTGTLEKLSREEVKEAIRKAGGKSAGSVSKNTDYVLAGENAGSKLDEAKKLGVKVIDEKEFLSLILS